MFQRELRWSLYLLVSVGMVVGLGAGMIFEHWIEMPQDPPGKSSSSISPAKVTEKPH